MASTAVVSLVDYRIRSGIPFGVRLAVALDAGVAIVSLNPYLTVTGRTDRTCSARFSTVSPSDRAWQGVVYQSAADDIAFSVGADIVLSNGTSIVASVATAWVVDSPEAGQAWFHVFEQSGMIPELFL